MDNRPQVDIKIAEYLQWGSIRGANYILRNELRSATRPRQVAVYTPDDAEWPPNC
jgi:hypothetical protein